MQPKNEAKTSSPKPKINLTEDQFFYSPSMTDENGNPAKVLLPQRVKASK
jgi:hypothetical protein